MVRRPPHSAAVEIQQAAMVGSIAAKKASLSNKKQVTKEKKRLALQL